MMSYLSWLNLLLEENVLLKVYPENPFPHKLGQVVSSLVYLIYNYRRQHLVSKVT